MRKRNNKGFTLIELMAVIVVLGVLSAAAVPMYMGYRDDARRAEARGAIAAIVTAQQYFWQANGTYTSNAILIGQRADLISEIANNWTFTVGNVSPNGFSVTMNARNWTNRAGQLLQVNLVYNRAAGTKTWSDDTGMLQTETT